MPGSSGPREVEPCDWFHEVPDAFLLKATSEDIDIEKRLADLELDKAVEAFAFGANTEDEEVPPTALDQMIFEIQSLKQTVVEELKQIRIDLAKYTRTQTRRSATDEFPHVKSNLSQRGESQRHETSPPDLACAVSLPSVCEDGSPFARARGSKDVFNASDISDRRRQSELVAISLQNESFRRLNRTFLQKLVDSTLYHSAVMCCVVAQSIGMGVEAQLSMDHYADVYASSGHEVTAVPKMYWFHVCFNSVFVLDLAARIAAWKREFFSPGSREAFAWNIFDASLVVLSLPDFVDVGTESLGFLRCVRLLRAVRIMRVAVFISNLRKMIYSFFSGAAQLLEVCALLLLVLYLFTLAFMQGASDELQAYGPVKLQALRNSSITSSNNAVTGNVIPLIFYYSSIRVTMVNLFATITGGLEWMEVLGPMMEAQTDLYYWMSVFYVFFFMFGFLNVVTAMFVDRAAMQFKKTDDEITQRRLAVENRAAELRIKDLIGLNPEDTEDEIDFHQLLVILKDKQIQDWFEKTEVDIARDLSHVISMLIPRDATSCTVGHFLRTFRRLRGEAKSFDLSLLLCESRVAFDAAVAFDRRQQHDMRRVLDGINKLTARMYL